MIMWSAPAKRGLRIRYTHTICAFNDSVFAIFANGFESLSGQVFAFEFVLFSIVASKGQRLTDLIAALAFATKYPPTHTQFRPWPKASVIGEGYGCPVWNTLFAIRNMN